MHTTRVRFLRIVETGLPPISDVASRVSIVTFRDVCNLSRVRPHLMISGSQTFYGLLTAR